MGALLLAAGALLPKLQVAEDSKSLGSITEGQEYNATSTSSNGAGLPARSVIKTSPGALGSVVITGATTGIINFFDATSTNHANHATTTIASIPASAAAGTYTFDVAFSRGLLVEVTGVAPTSTITWR